MKIAFLHNLQRLLAIWFVVLLCSFTAPSVSHASDPAPFTIDECNNGLGLNFETWEFTSKVVGCLRTTVIRAVLDQNNGYLIKISELMQPVVGIMVVLAVIIFGARIMGGEQNLKGKAMGFLLRLGLVWMFAFNLGGLGESVFDVMDQMICIVHPTDPSVAISIANVQSTHTGLPGMLPETRFIKIYEQGVINQCYPWNFIDLFVGRIFGFGEHILLTHGLLGIVAGALLSSTMGVVVFLTGFMAFLDIIFMILRVIFIYLSSLLVVAFMVIVSPLIIPLALFNMQERYFKRWLDILLTGMFIPMMMFAFVGAFMGIYELLIDRIVNILGGLTADGKTAFDAYWRLNQPRFSWMMPSDPNLAQDFEVLGNADDVGSSAVQTFINPYARRAVDTNLFVAPGVNFGEAGIKIMQELVLSFVSLWIFSSLMQSMIRKIPEVTQSIVGASLSITYQSGSFESGIRNAVNSARGSFGGGGGLGGGARPPGGARR